MSVLNDLDDHAEMFDLAPVSLWIEDYSALRLLFEQWREAGIQNLESFLTRDPSRVQRCSDCIRILKVNRKTLSLFGADDLDHLMANLGRVIRDDSFKSHVDELVQLWNGQTQFASHTVNYTLNGERLDIQLSGTILPGHEDSWDRIMVSIEDVTQRENARRNLAASETYASGLFAHSPVSLWVEDFSAVKKLVDDVRSRGVEDLRVFTDVHQEFVLRCMSEIRVIDVNSRTLELFRAPDKETLLRSLPDLLRDEMEQHFREQLIDLWNGKLFQQREVVNYTTDGTKLHLLLQFSVLPAHEHDWSLVQVALTDITARKKAEAYLEYLGTHDVLTRTMNRSFYVDELNRLERKGPDPVTVIIADINGLKVTNDELGHGVGDSLLRRAGEVFDSLVEKPASVSRIGGDEFAVLLPGTDSDGAKTVLASLTTLIKLNNQYHPDLELNVAIGSATSGPSERLEQTAKRADMQMLDEKRRFYAQPNRDSRKKGAA